MGQRSCTTWLPGSNGSNGSDPHERTGDPSYVVSAGGVSSMESTRDLGHGGGPEVNPATATVPLQVEGQGDWSTIGIINYWLVVFRHPSEKYESSQLGWLEIPNINGKMPKMATKPPTRLAILLKMGKLLTQPSMKINHWEFEGHLWLRLQRKIFSFRSWDFLRFFCGEICTHFELMG